MLLAAGVTIMLALALSLGASEAPAYCRGDCEGGGVGGSSGVGSWPYVYRVSPQDGATGVPTNTVVKVTFSEEMDPSTINGDTFQLWVAGSSERIPATVSSDPNSGYATYVLDPYGSDAGLLPADETFLVKVTTGVRSQDLNRSMLSEFNSYFRTSVAPTVTQVSPQGGATGVPRNTGVKVTFSEEMDPNTVNGSTFQLHTYDSIFYGGAFYYTEQIPATVSKDPLDATGRTWVLDPYGATSSTLLSANRKYRVTITTGAKDLDDGLPISSNKVWYFTAGSS
jgi:hypothetical protein